MNYVHLPDFRASGTLVESLIPSQVKCDESLSLRIYKVSIYNTAMNDPIVESVAKALLVTDQKEALILTIGEYKERPDKSFQPDLPGGLVDPGESERDAVVREIFEETGVKNGARETNNGLFSD